MTVKPRCAARCGGTTPCTFPVSVEIVIPGAGVKDDPDVLELCAWHGTRLAEASGLAATPLKQSRPDRVR